MSAFVPALAQAIDVLGWALIHFVWQGAALALALMFVRLLVPRSFARTRYIAGGLTLVAMLAAPVLTTMRLVEQTGRTGTAVSEAGSTDDAGAMTVALAPVARGTASASAVLAEDARVVIETSTLLPWLVLAWAAGVTLCALRLAGGWWQARRLVRVATGPVAAEVDRMVRALSVRLGLGRHVRLLASTRLTVPVVVGWLRPVLIVPAAVLGGLSPQQLEAVLAHELAHIRRHDYLVNLLQSAVETLLFYHPAVWWVSHTVRVEREHCCDDLAVVACGDAVLYARALTAIETMRHEEMGVAMAMTGSPLLARVRRLLGVKPPSAPASSGWVVAALTALMVAGAGVTSWIRGVPVELTDSAQAAQTAAQPVPPSQGAAAPVVEHESADHDVDQHERALAEASRAVDRAVRESERAIAAENRQDAAEARKVAREAMRQARDMVRDAQSAIKEASRAMREATREARQSSWSWHSSDAADGLAPEPPEPPEPPMPPLPPEPADVLAAPPAPPAPPALPAPPAPPAPPDWSLSSSSKDSTWNVTHTHDDVTLKINAKGAIEFTDDETDVKSLSSGGSIVIEQKKGGFFSGDVKRFEARENSGTVERKYLIGGREVGQAEGRAWLASFLPEILREMAINADKRVARQLAAGGPARVLDDTAKVKSDFAKSRYLRQLYRQVQLDGPMLDRSLTFAGQSIESDFELAQVLKTAADKQAVESSLNAFVVAARTIESDFEQRQVFQRLLARPGLTGGTAKAVLMAAQPAGAGAGIESAFELAQLLKVAARNGQVNADNAPAFLDAARAVESDFERGQVIAAISQVELPDATRADLVRLAASIGSDFERSQAVVRLARGGNHGPLTRKALAEAAMGIGNDFERGKALSALTRAGVLEAK
jgi:beta-lactamase regulating signal transducer with metallopeptidase domain